MSKHSLRKIYSLCRGRVLCLCNLAPACGTHTLSLSLSEFVADIAEIYSNDTSIAEIATSGIYVTEGEKA